MLPSPTSSVGKTEPNADAPPHSPTRAVRRTEGQRRAFLRNDVQAQEVEPQRVLCRVCEKWIKLSAVCNYGAGNWLAHKQRCSPATPVLRAPRRTPSKPSFSPSSRVATAERKIVLFNDAQVKVFSPRRVQCGKCMSVVVLEGTVDYELTKWTEHKETCIPSVFRLRFGGPGPDVRQNDPCTDHPTGTSITRPPTFDILPGFCRWVSAIALARG